MAVAGAHIQIDAVSHRYRARRALVLDAVRITIEPGEARAIIGRSGCGKSTLLHVMAGLIRPSAGAVYIDGVRAEGPSPRWVMLFQQPSLYPWMTVAGNAGIGLTFAGRPKDEIRRRVADALSLVGLADHAAVNVQQLSGGEQQRVALARSLVMQPELLLLDEPFSALDTFTRSGLQREVRAIAKRLGITLVLVTHDIDEAVLMADRVSIMIPDPGRIVENMAIALDDPRTRQDPRVAAVREQLMLRFEAVTGGALDDAAGVTEAPVPAADFATPLKLVTSRTR